MKVQYDPQVDALYLALGTKTPDGVVEVASGVNLDTTADGKVVGIEILDASSRIDIDTLLTYTLEFDPGRIRELSAATARANTQPSNSHTQ